MIKKLDQSPSKSEKKAFLSGIVCADVGRFKFDRESGVDSDSYEFANAMMKLAKTDGEKWFALGFKAHVLQDNKTKEVLNNTFGPDDHRAYMFKCADLDKYSSKQIGGEILYDKCLDKFNFEQVVDALEETGFKFDDLSDKYGVSPSLAKLIINIVLKARSWVCSKKYLTTYKNLIQKTYKSLNFEVSIEDIDEQVGNLLGTFMIALDLGNKTENLEELTSKIDCEFDKLADLCVSELKMQNMTI